MKKESGLTMGPPKSRTPVVDPREGDCQRPAACIFCSGPRVWWIGFHERSASVLEGDDVVYVRSIVFRRARCASCRDSWIVRALKFVPGRHFQLDVVGVAVARYLFDADATQRSVACWARCAERTIRRWIEWIGAVVTPRELVARLTAISGQPVRLTMPPMTGLSRSGVTNVHRTSYRIAAWNLVLLEGLAAALSLEPPGLRSVLLRVIGDRAGATTYARPALPELAPSLN